VSPLGRRIDESVPMVDARLKDGSRVNAIIPPLSLKGPVLTIRKFSREPFTFDKLIQIGSLTENVFEFMKVAVNSRRNIVISGGTSSGKTTLLNVLCDLLPKSERIVTIEDSAELQLPQEHLISLEARPPNIQGKGEVTIRDLVKNSLRMRPDRIVVGEVRGGEALDMLQAMNTGHDGSLTTGHANAPYDFLRRLETMVLMAGIDLPNRAIREQIASAIHIIVQMMRFNDGSRRVVKVSEMVGLDPEGGYQLLDVFQFKQEGVGEGGRVQGRIVPTGAIPNCFKELQDGGVPVNMEIFEVES
jgi:pilus assembly protein CpaF